MFLKRAVPYETLGAPLDPLLRKTVILSLVTTLVAGVGFLAFSGAPAEMGDDVFIRWLYVPLHGFISFLYDICPVVFWMNLGALLWGLALVVATKGLHEGNRVQNRMSLGPTCVATADAVALAVILALVALIVVVWVLIIALAIALAIAVIAILIAALAAWPNG